MAFEIPYDLINRVKISLRKEANISSYDPQDPSLPNLPSLEQSVSELDPSPPYLRCKQCKARLLMGLQSVVCVFCGQPQRQELPPDPINFRSTGGYSWFLKYLDLDGSEMVDPSLKANEPNRGKIMQNDEIPLSDLLDLEIKWPAKSEKHGASFANETSFQTKSSLNLVGVNLDSFFPDTKRDTTSSPYEEKSVSNSQIDSSKSNVFQGQGNLSLFDNVQPSDTAARSTEDKNGNSFSGWEAEFQSVGSETLRQESKSFDPFVGSTGDLSMHMDAVFGPGKDVVDEKKDTTIPSTSNMNNWFQDDLLSNSKAGIAGSPEQFEMSLNVNDGGKVETANNSSSMSVNLIQDDHLQTSGNKDPVSKTVYEDDDSFDVWNDFTGSTTAQDPPNSSWVQTVNCMTPSIEQASEIDLFSTTNNSQDINFGSFSQPDFFSGPLSNQNGLTGGNNTESEAFVPHRLAEAKAKDGSEAEDVGESWDFMSATKSPRADDAETLMSQMHDLSFMLDSNLSIPSKLG